MLRFLLVPVILLSTFSSAALDLGRNFKWCTATAAHQIEGNNRHSDWWNWELNHRGPHAPKEASGRATDHWNRLAEDTNLQSWLGTDRYRFSVEWAKIEPRPGQWNEAALRHYSREIDLLLANGIEPMVTLNHFTLPQWVADRGSWTWRGLPVAFERFTRKVVAHFGHRVGLWVTINEPMVLVAAGYQSNVFPPARNSSEDALQAAETMLRAHARAYRVIHESIEGARVGIAKHLRPFHAMNRYNPATRLAAHQLSQLFNWAFLDALTTGRFRASVPFGPSRNVRITGLRGSQDFLGINYYSRDRVTLSTSPPFVDRIVTPGSRTTDLGWEIYPSGMRQMIRRAWRKTGRRLPVVITENGLADHRDSMRVPFMRAHLRQLQLLMAEGVPIEGYCHWSLLDNFEWHEGYSPRFGLIEVNYQTLERRPRASARWFKRLIERHRD
jgi:beta-glucosidase